MAKFVKNPLNHVQNIQKYKPIAFADPSLRHKLQWLDQDDTLIGWHVGGVGTVAVFNIALSSRRPNTQQNHRHSE